MSEPVVDRHTESGVVDNAPVTGTHHDHVYDNEKTTTAGLNEKGIEHTPHGVTTYDNEKTGPAARGPSWMYRSWKLGPITFPYYASPKAQLLIVALVCFLCPGMYNSINGLGAGGNVDPKAADEANTALYATFSIVGFFAGSFTNRVGIKWTLGLGGIGYAIYVASFLSWNHNSNYGFTAFAGALLGACAGLLWCAQGTIVMSYPLEQDKGKYISWFWMIFNLGAVIGSLIPLGENLNNRTGTATDGTYIGFIVLMLFGAGLAVTLANTQNIVRRDGSRVITIKNPTWKTEILGMFEVFVTDWYILLLFPMFFASNFFYTYQFQVYNLTNFTLRTRSLNNLLYWFSQILGALLFGYLLDLRRVSRKVRAQGGWVALLVITMVIWGGGFAYQRGANVRPADGSPVPEDEKMDWTTPGYVGPMFLYMFYGFFDAAWQVTVYWFMGALTNNSRKLANFAGFYKGIQSAGGAGAYGLDLGVPSYLAEFGANWGLLAGSLLVAAPVIFLKIRDHVPIEDDLRYSDETIDEVAAPAEVAVTQRA